MKRIVYEKLLDWKSCGHAAEGQPTTISLDKFRKRFAPSAAEPFILHEKNLSVKDGVTRLPFYMAPWLVTGEEK